MKFWLINILVLVSVALFSQNKEENVTDYITKTDNLPFLKYEKGELDTLFVYNKIVPIAVEGSGSNCYSVVSFNVDRNGKIKNIKHISSKLDMVKGRVFTEEDAEPKLHEEVRKETERLVYLTEGLWFSDSVREKGIVVMNINFKSTSRKQIEENPNAVYSANQTANILTKKDLYNYGVKKMNTNKTLLAKIYFEQALVYYPKDVDAHYNLAACYYKLKRKSEACEHWNKCLELGDKTVTIELDKYCK